MKREIKFSLVYRDMWQSSGKYLPRVDQLVRVAPHIVDMGCFARVETNGGGFEQINLLFGENPNNSVRQWTQAFNDAGIQTHMLERALNGIRMSPVPADVRKLMFKVKKKQGTDIARSFCGLNDARNILDSVTYAKQGGMIAQAAMSITFSEVHTVQYYVNLATTLIEGGADEICLKDMAGVARPAWLGKITKGIKTLHPDIPIQYHSHSGPGFAMATILEVARAGADYIDVAMEPLSWGTGHVDLLAVHEMLKDDGFIVPDINLKAYMKVRSLTQEFVDDFLGYYINPRNRYMNSLLIGPGLPGGMMGSLMADLEKNLQSINKWLVKNNKPEISQDDLLIKLFDEVQYIWAMVGNPPLVTPYSQYVKNLALMNVMQLIKGKERWSMIADNIWDMMIGKGGELPGTLHPELKALAESLDKEFYTGNPQDLYPNNLDQYKKEMKENNWDFGQDDEELLELAMHPEQYRAYKSGAAKENFEKDLANCRANGAGILKGNKAPEPFAAAVQTAPMQPSEMKVEVDGEVFQVKVSYDADGGSTQSKPTEAKAEEKPKAKTGEFSQSICAPLEGIFYLTKESTETAIKVGDIVQKGDLIGYVEAMKTFNAIKSEVTGTVVEVSKATGEDVEEDDVLIVVN